MKDEESNNLNESNGSSTQAPKKLPYRPPYVVIILLDSSTLGKAINSPGEGFRGRYLFAPS